MNNKQNKNEKQFICDFNKRGWFDHSVSKISVGEVIQRSSNEGHYRE